MKTVEEHLADVVFDVMHNTTKSFLESCLHTLHGPTARFQNVERAGVAGVRVLVGAGVAATVWSQHAKRDARLYLRAFIVSRCAVAPKPMVFSNGRQRAVVFPNDTVVTMQEAQQ